MSNNRIRAHHGLCIAFFKGEGYSSDFVLNMKKIIDQLSDETLVTIISSTDDICASCPNANDDICVSAEKVNRYDRLVLEHCGIESNNTMPWSEFKEAVYTKIIKAGKMNSICSDCQWSYICFNS